MAYAPETVLALVMYAALIWSWVWYYTGGNKVSLWISLMLPVFMVFVCKNEVALPAAYIAFQCFSGRIGEDVMAPSILFVLIVWLAFTLWVLPRFLGRCVFFAWQRKITSG